MAVAGRRDLLMPFALSLLMRVGGMGATLLCGILLARGLGAEGMGVYGLLMSIVAFAMVGIEMGMPQLATREIANSGPGKIRSFLRWSWRNIVVLGLAFGIVIIAAGTAFSGWFGGQPISLFVAAAALALVSAGTNLAEACLRGFHEMTKGQIGLLLVRPALFGLFLLIGLRIAEGLDATQALTANAVASAITLILVGYWLSGKVPSQASIKESEDNGDTWWRAALPMAGTELMRIGQQNAVIIILGMLAALSTVGVYRVAVSILPVVTLPIVVANVVLAPRIAQLYANSDMTALRRLLPRSALLTLAGVLVMIAPLAVWGSQLLKIGFGDEFAQSQAPLIIMCVGYAVVAACGPCGTLLNMTGQETALLKATLVSVLAIVVLSFALIPLAGAAGAAGALGAGMCLWTFSLVRTVRNRLGLDPTVFGLIGAIRHDG